MEKVADLLFEAKILKEIPRSGYHFLGAGKESVAEHSFMITFIAYVMTQLIPDLDARKLIAMCLIHDLAEARTGDLNYVQKKYVIADENKAVKEITAPHPFGEAMEALIHEFNAGASREARLAKDADQLAFILDLKALADTGYKTPEKWIPAVVDRLRTNTGKKLAASILSRPFDEWWQKTYIDE